MPHTVILHVGFSSFLNRGGCSGGSASAVTMCAFACSCCALAWSRAAAACSCALRCSGESISARIWPLWTWSPISTDCDLKVTGHLRRKVSRLVGNHRGWNGHRLGNAASFWIRSFNARLAGRVGCDCVVGLCSCRCRSACAQRTDPNTAKPHTATKPSPNRREILRPFIISSTPVAQRNCFHSK